MAIGNSGLSYRPGDPFTDYELFTINIADKKLVKVDTEIYDFLEFPWINWRTNDNNFFSFEKADRGHQRFRITNNLQFTRLSPKSTRILAKMHMYQKVTNTN